MFVQEFRFFANTLIWFGYDYDGDKVGIGYVPGEGYIHTTGYYERDGRLFLAIYRPNEESAAFPAP